MKTTPFFLTSLLIALLGYAIPGQADDVDIYSIPVGNSADAPNMLIVLDTAANSNASVPSGSCTYVDGGLPSMDGKQIGVEQCTLYNTIYNLPVNPSGTARVNVGFMFYNANGLSCAGVAGGSAGGCLVQKITPMTTANKTIFLNWIKAWANITSSGEATGQAMQEAWAYYAGQIGISGRDYSTIQPHPQPWQTAPTCGNDYVIFIANAYGTNTTPGDGGLGTYSMTTGSGSVVGINNAPGVTIAPTNITLPNGVYNNCSSYTMGTHSDSSGLYADEWVRYMHFPPIKATTTFKWFTPITTYTIGALGPNCKSDYPALLTSMARRGGGKYYPTSGATDLSQAMKKIFNEVQAVNSVFSSSSLPVSVNTQGTFLNQIFMGMFRPDGHGNPRWLGNLKQYQFIYDPTTKVLQLGDATGAVAISGAGTGFLSTEAASYWTCTNATQSTALGSPYNTLPTCGTDPTTGFWLNQPSGTGGNFDLPDGEIVEKGGSAQQVRLANLIDNYTAVPGSTSNPRKLYTYCLAGTGCNTTLGATANVFDTSNAAITDVMLGTGSVAISSITSAATVLGGGASPGGSGTPTTVSITNLAKAGSTVTATVSPSSNVGTNVVVGTQLKISSGATKFDCNPCTVTAITPAAGTFTYTNAGGAGTATLPTTASIFSNYFWIYKIANGLPIGQTLTISGCTTYTALNGTVATVAVIPGLTHLSDYIDLAVATSVAGTVTDYGCQYTLNTATVTTSVNHGFPNNSSVTIAGVTPAGYNGSWIITNTGANTFTYQYSSAAPLGNATIVGSASSSTTTRDALTRWVRGEDNYGDEASLCPPGNPAGVNGCPTPAVNMRPSLHGDVLHSRPVVLNYGGTTGVVVFYGSNDGVYHAINGNQANPVGSTLPAPGAELWGFIPSEFFSKLKRQHDNSPVLLVPSTPAGIIPAPTKKDYFADGPTGVYQLIDGNGVTLKAYLYIAMRRGGRLIYALDVTDPANPKYLWSKSSADTDTQFGELGQTWSQPKIAIVKGYANPVLVFGAGYDAAAEDTEPPTADAMGRGIFILDAFTGVRVWNAKPSASATSCSGTATQATCSVAGMNYSIPSDLTMLDRDNDGKIDRLYATDVGGNVWRVDFEPTAGNTPDKWQVNQLAALGCNGGICASGISPRKLFYPAEVIATKTYDAVFVGSGDREHPLGSYVTGTTTPTANTSCAVANQVYMLVDLKIGKDGSGQALITQTGTAPNVLFNATAVAYPGQGSPATNRGYYITMGVCEKIVNAPLVVAGYVYFGTNTPEPPTTHRCEEPLGEATGYKLQPFTGALTGEEFNGGGLPPSPVAGVVNIVVNGVVTQVPFCIGCGGGEDQSGNQSGSGDSGCGASALAGCKPPINVTPTRTRTFWYQQNK